MQLDAPVHTHTHTEGYSRQPGTMPGTHDLHLLHAGTPNIIVTSFDDSQSQSIFCILSALVALATRNLLIQCLFYPNPKRRRQLQPCTRAPLVPMRILWRRFPLLPLLCFLCKQSRHAVGAQFFLFHGHCQYSVGFAVIVSIVFYYIICLGFVSCEEFALRISAFSRKFVSIAATPGKHFSLSGHSQWGVAVGVTQCVGQIKKQNKSRRDSPYPLPLTPLLSITLYPLPHYCLPSFGECVRLEQTIAE